jgi:hypothetical protein
MISSASPTVSEARDLFFDGFVGALSDRDHCDQRGDADEDSEHR